MNDHEDWTVMYQKTILCQYHYAKSWEPVNLSHTITINRRQEVSKN